MKHGKKIREKKQDIRMDRIKKWGKSLSPTCVSHPVHPNILLFFLKCLSNFFYQKALGFPSDFGGLLQSPILFSYFFSIIIVDVNQTID